MATNSLKFINLATELLKVKILPSAGIVRIISVETDRCLELLPETKGGDSVELSACLNTRD
jgi:hypothetical protein